MNRLASLTVKDDGVFGPVFDVVIKSFLLLAVVRLIVVPLLSKNVFTTLLLAGRLIFRSFPSDYQFTEKATCK